MAKNAGAPKYAINGSMPVLLLELLRGSRSDALNDLRALQAIQNFGESSRVVCRLAGSYSIRGGNVRVSEAEITHDRATLQVAPCIFIHRLAANGQLISMPVEHPLDLQGGASVPIRRSRSRLPRQPHYRPLLEAT